MAANILQITYARAKADLTGNLVRAEILCDTAADLPAVNAFSGYELLQGSKSHVIDDNNDYMLDSGGSWHPYGGTDWQNVYTKSETDMLLDAKQEELSAVQMDAVNSGITAAILTELQSYHTINSIPSNSDVDDYSDRGIYTVGSASVAASITHTPFTSAGYVLFVLPSYQAIGSTRGKIQVAVTRIANVTNLRLRWFAYGSGVWAWSAWESILPIS